SVVIDKQEFFFLLPQSLTIHLYLPPEKFLSFPILEAILIQKYCLLIEKYQSRLVLPMHKLFSHFSGVPDLIARIQNCEVLQYPGRFPFLPAFLFSPPAMDLRLPGIHLSVLTTFLHFYFSKKDPRDVLKTLAGHHF